MRSHSLLLIVALLIALSASRNAYSLTVRWNVNTYWIDGTTPFNGFCRILWGPEKGNLTNRRDVSCIPGTNSAQLSVNDFPTTGSYFITVKTVSKNAANQEVESPPAINDQLAVVLAIPPGVSVVGVPVANKINSTVAALFPSLPGSANLYIPQNTPRYPNQWIFAVPSFNRATGAWTAGATSILPTQGFFFDNPSTAPLKVVIGGAPVTSFYPPPQGLSLISPPGPLTQPLGYTGAQGTHQFPAAEGDMVFTYNISTQRWIWNGTYSTASRWSYPGPQGPIIGPGQVLLILRAV